MNTTAPQAGFAPFRRVALIGLGLIGSSLARAIKAKGLAEEVAGSARSEETLATVRRLGFCDSLHADPAEAVAGADLVILCTPVGTFEALGRKIAGALEPGAIVSDVGSVKQAVIRDLGPSLPEGVHFIPGHPIAGTEKSGPEAGFPELFEDRWSILTPPPGADQAALARLKAFWGALGSRVAVMDAGHHDKVLAVTSHLPHLIAYTIVGTAEDLEAAEKAEVVKYSAGGFRDFTRIAASDPVMWRDVFLNNREAVLEILQRFTEDLTALQRAIRWGEGEVLEERFRRTREIRRGVVEAQQAGTFDPREPEKARTAVPVPGKTGRPED